MPGQYWISSENLRWVQASLDLVRAFGEHGGQRAVLAGTCAEYNWDYGYCTESITPLAPRTLYGACKHGLHSIAAAYAAQINLSLAWGRIFFPYGSYEHPARLPPGYSRLLNGQPAACTPGEQIRDFLHVEDVAAAFVAILESDISGAIDVASGEPVAVKDLSRRSDNCWAAAI